MSTLTAGLRDALRDRFQDTFGERLHRLILYGSPARGEATEDSDVDLLVLLKVEGGGRFGRGGTSTFRGK